MTNAPLRTGEAVTFDSHPEGGLKDDEVEFYLSRYTMYANLPRGHKNNSRIMDLEMQTSLSAEDVLLLVKLKRERDHDLL
jgi:hypothetical protein